MTKVTKRKKKRVDKMHPWHGNRDRKRYDADCLFSDKSDNSDNVDIVKKSDKIDNKDNAATLIEK